MIVVFDGNAFLHRAFHAYKHSGMTNREGDPTWAVHGFFTLMAKNLDLARLDKKRPVSAVLVGFDAHTTERRLKHPDYKATRPPRDPELHRQMAATIELLQEAGFPVALPDAWEADDVLGSAAKAARSKNWVTVLATHDRDSFQLIRPDVHVLLGDGSWMTPQAVEEKYGITPERYVELAAMRGDASDNLPGVPGIGPKTASKILKETTMDKILSKEPQALQTAGKKAKAMEDSIDVLKLNMDMMTINCDLDLPDTAFDLFDIERACQVLNDAGLVQAAGRLRRSVS